MNAEVFQRVANDCGTPTFVYSETRLRQNIREVQKAARDAGLGERLQIYAAYFTNSHPALFRIVAEEGVGATIQSLEELAQLDAFGLDKINKVVSPTALAQEDLLQFLERDIPVNISLLEELEFAFANGKEVGIRIDLSESQDQRTGFKRDELDEVRRICVREGREVRALHTYPGTLSAMEGLLAHAEKLLAVHHKEFPNVKELNFGGGFRYEYAAPTRESKHFPWRVYFSQLRSLVDRYQLPKEVVLSIEPGRDLFADVGELLVRVNRVHARKGVQQVFTDGSYVLMPSATIRARQHEVRFFDASFRDYDERRGNGILNGCTTLSRDYLFPGQVSIPEGLTKGSFVVVKDIGAYGASQHMEFLNKRPAAEVLLRTNGALELITERGAETDRIRYALREPRKLA
ncbi:MAG: hypothetical protein Q7S65_04925 [Nanoarchaeota archaeon]|nr:hypothetical protein [Nanoarchaeota archaeon]